MSSKECWKYEGPRHELCRDWRVSKLLVNTTSFCRQIFPKLFTLHFKKNGTYIHSYTGHTLTTSTLPVHVWWKVIPSTVSLCNNPEQLSVRWTDQINPVTMSHEQKVEVSTHSQNKQPQSILTSLHHNLFIVTLAAPHQDTRGEKEKLQLLSEQVGLLVKLLKSQILVWKSCEHSQIKAQFFEVEKKCTNQNLFFLFVYS